jgi:hypothetical protein
VLSVAEAARGVLAKLPRLHVERLAIDDARGRVRGAPADFFLPGGVGRKLLGPRGHVFRLFAVASKVVFRLLNWRCGPQEPTRWLPLAHFAQGS